MTLTFEQKRAIELLSGSNLRDIFYWTGGTLLSHHYLHHRLSYDLDFFSEKPFSFELINSWVQSYKITADVTNVKYQKVFDRWEFLFEGKNPLRIEFVYYNHEKKTLGKRKLLYGVYIDSLEDIAANKTIAYVDRNEPKDLFDIYFLMTKTGFDVSKLLQLTHQKFGVTLPESLFWSESFKTLPLLTNIKPLILAKDEKEKNDLVEKIVDFFQKRSENFLRNKLQ